MSWYEVKPGNDGSYSYTEAVEMLQEKGYGYIEVYDDFNYCEREIHFDDIRG